MIRGQGKGQVIHLAHGLFSGAHKKMSNVSLMSETKTEDLGLKIDHLSFMFLRWLMLCEFLGSHWQPVSVIHVQTEHFIPAVHELLASPGIICPLVRCLPVGQSGMAREGEMVRWLNYFSCPLPLPEESMVGQLLMEHDTGKEVSAMIHVCCMQAHCRDRFSSRPPQ